jgi:hypothetical protein
VALSPAKPHLALKKAKRSHVIELAFWPRTALNERQQANNPNNQATTSIISTFGIPTKTIPLISITQYSRALQALIQTRKALFRQVLTYEVK